MTNRGKKFNNIDERTNGEAQNGSASTTRVRKGTKSGNGKAGGETRRPTTKNKNDVDGIQGDQLNNCDLYS